jgi:putative flippase GtrA
VSSIALRWIKFNFVGALGIAVQMGALAVFREALHLNKIWATALAVETAVLHNFVWHEKFTWSHLPRGDRRDIALRLLRFHAGNGLISIAGNVLIVALLTGPLGLGLYISNGAAIAVCALANFAASEWFVFRR